jgi:hypothetical protein
MMAKRAAKMSRIKAAIMALLSDIFTPARIRLWTTGRPDKFKLSSDAGGER